MIGVDRNSPELGNSVVDELMRFSMSSLGGQAGLLSWIYSRDLKGLPMVEQGHIMATSRISHEHLPQYPMAQAHDPFNLPSLLEQRRAVSRLSATQAIHSQNNLYVQFLSRFGISDELNFLLFAGIEPVAVLAIFRTGNAMFQDEPMDYDAFHRYVEFNFGFHPWVSKVRTLHLLRTVHGLTAREIEILDLIEDGASNADICDILKISLPTVKTHVVHILDKMGADSRNQLSALVRRI